MCPHERGQAGIRQDFRAGRGRRGVWGLWVLALFPSLSRLPPRLPEPSTSGGPCSPEQDTLGAGQVLLCTVSK